MASTKKEHLENKKVDNISDNEEVKKENVEVVKKETKRKKREFDKTDLIPCICVFPGSVGMIGKRTGNKYVWEDMNVIEYVEYQDLRSEILNKKSACIYEPLIVVQDKDFIEQNTNLKKLYEKVYNPEEIMENIEDLNVNEMIDFINSLPNGIKEGVKNIASTMITDGTLDSVRKIKALDDLFDTNLQMYSYD